MADSTIGNLTSGSPAQGSDEFPIQRGGSTLKLTVQDVLDQIPSPAFTFDKISVPVDSSSLQDLANTPFTIAGNPGTGCTRIITSWSIQTIPGNTPYTDNGGSLQLLEGGSAIIAPVTEVIVFDADTQGRFVWMNPTQEGTDGYTFAGNVASIVHQPVLLNNPAGPGTDVSGGNGTIVVTIYFILITGLPDNI